MLVNCVCEETQPWVYDDAHFATQPSEDAIQNALQARAVQCPRLDPDQPAGFERQMDHEDEDIIGAVTLFRLRQCLGEGYPVIFGFRYYWEVLPFKDKKSGFWDIGSLPGKNGPTEGHGGHAVLAISFDDENKQVLCQNSWGETKDLNGQEVKGAPLFWMGYNWVRDFEAMSNFWMIRLVDKANK